MRTSGAVRCRWRALLVRGKWCVLPSLPRYNLSALFIQVNVVLPVKAPDPSQDFVGLEPRFLEKASGVVQVTRSGRWDL